MEESEFYKRKQDIKDAIDGIRYIDAVLLIREVLKEFEWKYEPQLPFNCKSIARANWEQGFLGV